MSIEMTPLQFEENHEWKENTERLAYLGKALVWIAI